MQEKKYNKIGNHFFCLVYQNEVWKGWNCKYLPGDKQQGVGKNYLS